MLRPAREAEYPAKCLSVACTPADCRPRHVGGADRADQVGVLADGLLGPAPARVPGHVEHGRQALVDADRPHAGADGRGHLADQYRVERRPPRPAASGRWWPSRRRSRSGTPRAPPPGCRTGSRRRPAPEAAPACAGRRRGHRPRAEHAGELPEAVADELVQRRPLGSLEVVLHRGDAALVAAASPQPDAAQLGDLLLQRHPAEQVRDPFGGRAERVAPDLAGAGVRRARAAGSPRAGHAGAGRTPA